MNGIIIIPKKSINAKPAFLPRYIRNGFDEIAKSKHLSCPNV